MPIYEYKCLSCGYITTVLVSGYTQPHGLRCDSCASDNLKRIVSATNVHKSHSDRLSSYDPRSRHTEGFYRDTRNIGLHAEHMLKKAGVEPTEEFRSKLERLRTDPSSVIKDSE